MSKFIEVTKDPIACKLFLPGYYGSRCLDKIEYLISRDIGCSYDEKEISCTSGVRSQKKGIADCEQYQEQDLKDFCHQERTRILDNVFECDLISPDPPELREECQRWYAFKMKDTSLCASIEDIKRRQLCELRIDNLNPYPEFQSSFSISDASTND